MSGIDTGEAVTRRADSVQYRWYIVAVIDVLGQKEAIRQLQKVPLKEDNRSEITVRLHESVGKRNLVRDLATGVVTSFRNASSAQCVQQMPPETKGQVGRCLHCGLKTYSFSDTVVLYAPLMTPNKDPAVWDVYRIMENCAWTLLGSVSDSVPIRGAIEIGTGIECEGDELYGPGFLAAFELQERIAQYPRIVLGKELGRWLNLQMSMPGDDRVAQDVRAHAEFCRNLANIDQDGVPFLDFLGEGIRKKIGSGSNRDLVQKGLDFARKEHQRFVEAGDHKLALRYARLRQYYEARAGDWVL
ncbi:MAG: hypothetical protein NTU53_19800 [Planctomycetota bacterium]|nr:hypothetical protein [Planctomycetota bacterium]